MNRWAQSEALYERARKSLAGGVSSNVRAGARPFPLFFDHAEGAHLYDVDGNRYIDYVLGQGPMILGHSNPGVLAAVSEAMSRGQLYAGQHRSEITVAESLVRLIPSAQLCRFGLSGSEMVQTAMRLARAVTGRNMILRFEGHYHGWFDNVLLNVAPPLESIGPRERPPVQLMSAGQSPSVISDTLVLPWNDLALVEQLAAAEGEQIAAIICEPMMCNTGAIPPQPGYLNGLRAICDRIGALLIIDEVITGFRVGLQGAQGRFGVVPDLAIFGKAMAGGFAAAALVGRADVMIRVTQDVNHSGTFNSNVISMAATEAALAELEKDDGAIYRSMWQVGTRLMDGIRAIAARLDIPLLVQGLPTAFHVSFTDEPAIRDYRDYVYYCDRQRYSRFSLALLERGVRTIERGIWYLSAAHTSDHVDQTLEAVEGALRDTSD